MIKLLSFLLVVLPLSLCAQFAPQAGMSGSTAIHKDSNIIKAWALGCTYVQGWMDLTNIGLGAVTGSVASDATGYPDGVVVSLGDMGSVTYFFENPLVDSQGYDFAVFENGFRDPLDPSMAFLEFAFVEASSDGVNWARFQSVCNIDTTTQIPIAGVYSDARKVHNLAGKYVANYGTPFDLFDLALSSSVQLDKIHFIRIIDVVGAVSGPFGGRDMFNHVINDPFPTPINTGGFDLDALGIIHQKYPLATPHDLDMDEVFVYPNPAEHSLYLRDTKQVEAIHVFDLLGRNIPCSMEQNKVDIHHLSSGHYVLQVRLSDHRVHTQRFQKW